jgi:hypothetical protein
MREHPLEQRQAGGRQAGARECRQCCAVTLSVHTLSTPPPAFSLPPASERTRRELPRRLWLHSRELRAGTADRSSALALHSASCKTEAMETGGPAGLIMEVAHTRRPHSQAPRPLEEWGRPRPPPSNRRCRAAALLPTSLPALACLPLPACAAGLRCRPSLTLWGLLQKRYCRLYCCTVGCFFIGGRIAAPHGTAVQPAVPFLQHTDLIQQLLASRSLPTTCLSLLASWRQ